MDELKAGDVLIHKGQRGDDPAHQFRMVAETVTDRGVVASWLSAHGQLQQAMLPLSSVVKVVASGCEEVLGVAGEAAGVNWQVTASVPVGVPAYGPPEPLGNRVRCVLDALSKAKELAVDCQLFGEAARIRGLADSIKTLNAM